MPLLHTHHIVDLYCWIDALTPAQEKQTIGRPQTLTDTETVTALVWGTITAQSKTMRGVYDHLRRYHAQDFPRFPAYTTFVRRAHECGERLFAVLSLLLSDTEAIRIMDSTMLPVCKLHRVDEHKTAKNIAQFGKNWQGWHYGFKLHASVSLDGRLSGIALTPANVYDAQAMVKILNTHCKLAVGDTLYGARVMGTIVRERFGTVIIAPPFPKQRKKIAAPWQIALLEWRSKIESVFDYLKEHMHLVSSFPRSVAGYMLHYLRILLSYQIMALCKER